MTRELPEELGAVLHEGATLGDLFVRAARRFSEREALVADGCRWTYAALAQRVARMGAVLRRAGLSPGDALAILSHNRADVLVVYLAAVVEGLRLTPLAALSSVADQAFVLVDAEIDVLIVDAALVDRIPSLRDAATRLRQVFSLGPSPYAPDLTALTDVEPPTPLSVKRSPSKIAMIYYTGGTTGQPKGVAHTNASAMAMVMMAASEWEWPQELKMLAVTPVSHAAGAFVWPTFLKGGTFHILPSFSVEAFAKYVAREQITATFLVPTVIYRVLDQVDLEDSQLASLETIVYGAAPMAPARLAEAIRRFGPIFMQLYGQTEAPNCISYLAKSQHDLDDPEALSSAGHVLGAVQLSLLDEACEPVQDGTIGEICVRGAFVMHSYWKRPDETARAFEGGWLHTGDMGQFDGQGRLHIVDRKKDMIISGGFNVYPSEIELVLARAPGIAACAVVGLPDSVWGEAVTAAVVLTPGEKLDTEALRDLVREHKGSVHTPKHVFAVSDLPVTAVGKVDKKALRMLLAPKTQQVRGE